MVNLTVGKQKARRVDRDRNVKHFDERGRGTGRSGRKRQGEGGEAGCNDHNQGREVSKIRYQDAVS